MSNSKIQVCRIGLSALLLMVGIEFASCMEREFSSSGYGSNTTQIIEGLKGEIEELKSTIRCVKHEIKKDRNESQKKQNNDFFNIPTEGRDVMTRLSSACEVLGRRTNSVITPSELVEHIQKSKDLIIMALQILAKREFDLLKNGDKWGGIAKELRGLEKLRDLDLNLLDFGFSIEDVRLIHYAQSIVSRSVPGEHKLFAFNMVKEVLGKNRENGRVTQIPERKTEGRKEIAETFEVQADDRMKRAERMSPAAAKPQSVRFSNNSRLTEKQHDGGTRPRSSVSKNDGKSNTGMSVPGKSDKTPSSKLSTQKVKKSDHTKK